jgi:drug/metabolite transporter (DMT)-like permease
MTWLLIVSMIVFGFSWISGKRISSSAPPGVLSLIRASITALCFLPLLFWSRRKRLSSDSGMRGWLWTAASALSIAAYNLFFFSGLAAGPAGKGGLIVTTLNPVFTFLIISITAGKRIGKAAYAGLLLGFLGGILLLEPWNYRLGGVGNSAFLFAALSWSLLTVFSRKALSSLDFRIFSLRLHSLAALLLLPAAIHETGGRIPAGLGIPFWSDMILIAALAGAVGTGIYFMATSRLGADRTSSFSYLVPLSAVIFSGVLLGEKPELITVAGGILSIAAIFIINRRN